MWQQLDIRQGDRLPSLALIVTDDDGGPIAYDALNYKSTLRLTHHRLGTVFERDVLIVPSTPPTISYDWQVADWYELDVGTYDLSVQVFEAVTNRPIFTAPSRRFAIVNVRPYAPLAPV